MTRNVIYTLLLLLTFSCADKNGCADACTEEFRMVQLKIQNTNGDPVVLDKFTVILTDSNRDITQDLLFDAPIDGYYPIIDDNFREEAHSSHLKVQFTGIINDAIVVQENYVIEADCCHINLVSGKTGITI